MKEEYDTQMGQQKERITKDLKEKTQLELQVNELKQQLDRQTMHLQQMSQQNEELQKMH